MLAAAVHTTGINVESVAVIITGIVVPGCAAGGWLIKRVERRRTAAQLRAENFVRSQVLLVSQTLNVKLDQVSTHLKDQDRTLARQGRQLSDVRDRTARIEGRLANH